MGAQVRLVEGTALVRRGSDALQVGGDPDHHVVLTGLSEPQQAWLLRAARRARPPALDAAPAGEPAPSTVPPPGCEHLIARLVAAGFATHTTRRSAAAPVPGARAPSVRIDGLDAVTTAAAMIFARVGVRHLDLRDRRPVDTSVQGTVSASLWALPRPDAVRDMIVSLEPRTRVERLHGPDVVVVSRARHADAAACGLLLVEDRRHLPVILRERSIVVGPLVRPGRTPCAQCLDLHLTDADRSWPLLARQMADWPLPAPPVAAIQVAALEVARRVLSAPGGDPILGEPAGGDPAWSQVRVDARGGIAVREVAPHPRCGCGAAGDPFD